MLKKRKKKQEVTLSIPQRVYNPALKIEPAADCRASVSHVPLVTSILPGQTLRDGERATSPHDTFTI